MKTCKRHMGKKLIMMMIVVIQINLRALKEGKLSSLKSAEVTFASWEPLIQWFQNTFKKNSMPPRRHSSFSRLFPQPAGVRAPLFLFLDPSPPQPQPSPQPPPKVKGKKKKKKSSMSKKMDSRWRCLGKNEIGFRSNLVFEKLAKVI